MRVIENKKAIEIQELDRFGPSARRNTLLLWSVGLYWPSYDLACVLRGSLPTLYSLWGRVTSRLDLGDNRKVITYFIVSSGYLPGVLRGASSSAVLRKALSRELGTLGGATHVVYHGYPGSYPPLLVPECLASVVQRRLELV